MCKYCKVIVQVKDMWIGTEWQSGWWRPPPTTPTIPPTTNIDRYLAHYIQCIPKVFTTLDYSPHLKLQPRFQNWKKNNPRNSTHTFTLQVATLFTFIRIIGKKSHIDGFSCANSILCWRTLGSSSQWQDFLNKSFPPPLKLHQVRRELWLHNHFQISPQIFKCNFLFCNYCF